MCSSVICKSGDVTECSNGVRFFVSKKGIKHSAFVIRYNGMAYAYLNRCAHKGLELDWNPGQFFDRQSQYLICATHDARYVPDSGLCIAGPCVGASLAALPVVEKNDLICLQNDEDDVHLVS
jgi:nitrite reductase/ring-hydroxylating ferredoxin subunit